jgi:hypothetical protein
MADMLLTNLTAALVSESGNDNVIISKRQDPVIIRNNISV